jgi:hypothetical protein
LRISVVSTRLFVLWGNGSIVVSDDQGATWYAGPRIPNGLGGRELAVGGATGDWLYVLASDRTLLRYAHTP